MLLACAIVRAQDVSPQVQQHFTEAQEAQKAGQLDKAIQEYSTVLRFQPGIPEVYGNLGLAYYLKADFEDSAAAFEKAIAGKPGLRGADLFLGIDYVKLYRARKAVPHLEKAVEQEPRNPQAISWLCDALWNAGETSGALDRLRKAVRDFPGDVNFLFLLGESYRKSANREVEKVIAGTTLGSPFYHQIYGDIYSLQHNWDLAIAHYQRALALDPHWEGAHYGLGEVYLQQNKLDQAKAEFRQELRLDPDRASASTGYRQAVANFNRGAFEATEHDLQVLLAKNPNDLKARYLLGRTYGNLSLSTLAQLLAAAPDSYRAHQLQAQTYAYRDEVDKALAEYRIVEQQHPELPGLHFAVGELFWKNRDAGQAKAEFQKELRLNPDHAEANAELGTILVSEHEPATAISYLEKALRLKPDLTIVHEQLGKAFYQQKRFQQAIGELRQALATDQDGNVYYMLGMVYRDMGRSQESQAALSESRKIKAEHLASIKIERPPANVKQEYQLAVLLSEKHKYAEALEHFQALAQADPTSRANQFNLALAYLNAQNPEAAINILKGLSADAEILGLLGRAYQAESKSAEALDAYRRALEADPENPDRYLDYTQLLMDGNRFEQAAQPVTDGLKVVKDRYPLYLRLGSIRLLEGKPAEARQCFQEAIHLHPEIALGYAAMAKSYLQEGANREAANVLSDARRKLPQDFMLDYFYGLALLHLEQNREAADVFEDAVRLAPNVPQPHYELGRAYFALNQLDRARSEFERVIQLAPKDANAHYQLSRVYAKLGNTEKARELAEQTRHLKQTELDEALEIEKARLASFER